MLEMFCFRSAMEQSHPTPASPEPDASPPEAPRPDAPDPAALDPELEPLLGFAPVRRCTRRSDGWPPERQRGFVAALARLGNVDRAAHTVGRTASGAYKVRTSAGAEAFAAAWDGALALYHTRNPRIDRVGRPSRGELRAASAPFAPPKPPADPEERKRATLKLLEGMLHRYVLKLGQERTARLAGRIAEADYYVRQLTVIEIVLDLGGKAQETLNALVPRDMPLPAIAATPMSVLLDRLRRKYWAEGGEPERPPLGELGDHRDGISTGPPTYYTSGRDGDYDGWCRRQKEHAALAAEAQAAWEEKARADAKAWREREGEGGSRV